MADTKYYLDEAGLRALWEKLNSRDQTIVAKIAANKDAIDLLNATGEDGAAAPLGSVQRTVADEIARIVGDAPDSLDTIYELAAWIDSNPNGAAAMNALIQANKDEIDKIKTLLGFQEEENEVTSARLDAIETKNTNQDARLDDLEAALGTGGTGDDSISQKVANLTEQVETNTEDIAVLKEAVNGATGEDSLADRIAALEDTVNGGDGADDKSLEERIAALETEVNGEENEDSLGERVETLEAAISDLDTTAGIPTATIDEICVFTSTFE